MTVSSLWTVLDKAQCGKPVGEAEMLNPNRQTRDNINPWNYNDKNTSNSANRGQSLAVDLSIWICEAVTSSAMSNNHANAAVHLVYTRTVKLLSLGFKLVFVIEGKRRIRRAEGDGFRKRRSGTAFWKACKDCEQVLKLLGVPVVRAKAEGEALCAILNQRGIVDGVISNDGDCLLFGAKVLYTKFSIDNLQQSRVMRYDATKLYAHVYGERDDDEVPDETQNENRFNNEDNESIQLSRDDLIAFALLTGSDLAGDGLPKVGHKKAVRFIRKCQLDYPLSKETAAMDELKSWGGVASAIKDSCVEVVKTSKSRCCTVCTHPGDKRSHEKHGCELCGTNPGEPCFDVSEEDKFRKSLRAKALRMTPKFEPVQVFAAYMKPNDNQIPHSLSGTTSETLHMRQPRLTDMLNVSLVIKGRCLQRSQEFVTQTLTRLLARTDLFRREARMPGEKRTKRGLSKEVPVPLRITKRLVRNRVPCYEVLWSVSATLTDAEGNAADGYEFSTVESQALIEKHYQEIVADFHNSEKELDKQGDAMVFQRQSFIENLMCGNKPKQMKKGELKKRSGFFHNNRSRNVACKRQKLLQTERYRESDDVINLRKRATKQDDVREMDRYDFSSIEDCSLGSNECIDEIQDGDSILSMSALFDPPSPVSFASHEKHYRAMTSNSHDETHQPKERAPRKRSKSFEKNGFKRLSIEGCGFNDEIQDTELSFVETDSYNRPLPLKYEAQHGLHTQPYTTPPSFHQVTSQPEQLDWNKRSRSFANNHIMTTLDEECGRRSDQYINDVEPHHEPSNSSSPPWLINYTSQETLFTQPQTQLPSSGQKVNHSQSSDNYGSEPTFNRHETEERDCSIQYSGIGSYDCVDITHGVEPSSDTLHSYGDCGRCGFEEIMQPECQPLSPSRSVFCDLGIDIQVTPLVPRWRRGLHFG